MPGGGSGFSDASELIILNSATVGVGRTLYIALFKWTGAANGGAGFTVNDDASFPAGVSELTGNGYARLAVNAGEWTIGGTSPVTAATNVTKAWGAGAAQGELCGWGLYTTVTAGALYACGILTNNGTAATVTVGLSDTFQFDINNPIRLQLGDPGDPFV